jgi:HD superfamily phosphohydrolase
MTDAELINELNKMGPFQHEIATRLKFRNLFKQAYYFSDSKLDKGYLDIINKLENTVFRRKKEQEIEDFLNIPSGHVIIDVPRKELYQAEPRIDQTDITILDEEDQKKIDYYTPVAKAIRSRAIPDWMVMIVTDEKYRDLISKKAEKILFN